MARGRAARRVVEEVMAKADMVREERVGDVTVRERVREK